MSQGRKHEISSKRIMYAPWPSLKEAMDARVNTI